MASVTINDAKVVAKLLELQQKTDNIRPALLEIGEELLDSIHYRFEHQIAPDGSAWEANSWATILRKGSDKPPGTGETGRLKNESSYDVLDRNTLEIKNSRKYAAMFQFGGTKDEFPNLWGDVPGRPFLGLSEADEEAAVNIIDRYLAIF